MARKKTGLLAPATDSSNAWWKGIRGAMPASTTLEVYNELLEEKIKEIIPKLNKLQSEVDLKGTYTLGGKQVNGIKMKKSYGSRIKKLKRMQGALQFTDAKFFEKTFLYKSIIENVDKYGYEVGLDKAWGQWDGFMHDFKYEGNELRPGVVVGHHRIALNILREAVSDIPGNVRADLKRIAAKHGYNLGNEFLSYLDPGAHKGWNQQVTGIIASRLGKEGVLAKADLPEQFIKDLVDRSAHSRYFGDTGGLTLPKELVKPGASAKQIFKVARPYLEMAKIGDDVGVNLHKQITGDWNNLEELSELIKKNHDPMWSKAIKTAEQLENTMNAQLYEAGLLTDKLDTPEGWKTDEYNKRQARPSTVKSPFKKGQTIEDVYNNVWKPVDERGLKGLTRKMPTVTAAGVTTVGLSLLPTVASAKTIRGAMEGENTWTEAGQSYGKEALIGAGMAKSFQGSMQLAQKVAQTSASKQLAKASTRTLLKLGGKQLVKSLGSKAAASLIGGYAAPIVFGGLLAKDVYDVTNILTGGALEAKQIRGRSGAKRAIKASKNEPAATAVWDSIADRSQRRLQTRTEEEEYNLL